MIVRVIEDFIRNTYNLKTKIDIIVRVLVSFGVDVFRVMMISKNI